MQVLGFAEYKGQAEALARALDAEFSEVACHQFPDEESLVQLPVPMGRTVALCRSLDRPNDKLIELLLAAETARTLGAERVVLVAPYLCYMRQDKAFASGQSVSQSIVGDFLARHFDAVVTVDPHLHRVASLREAVPAADAVAVSAAEPMGDFLNRQKGEVLVVGPDSESEQWAATIAAAAGAQCVVGEKTRRGDRDVEIRLPQADYRGRHVVLVDDVASTGQTLANAALGLRSRGAGRISALVTHGLFAPGAEQAMAAAGIEDIWTTDTIPHPTNVITVVPLAAKAVQRIVKGFSH
jgi:ribose-phosphate pyrophosphokinase